MRYKPLLVLRRIWSRPYEELYDLPGHLVRRRNLQKGDNAISLQLMNKGIYILKILGSNQNIRTIKIVKQ